MGCTGFMKSGNQMGNSEMRKRGRGGRESGGGGKQFYPLTSKIKRLATHLRHEAHDFTSSPARGEENTYTALSGPIFTTIFPKLSPLNRPINALGAFSIPSATVSRHFSFPACAQPAMSRTKSPIRLP